MLTGQVSGGLSTDFFYQNRNDLELSKDRGDVHEQFLRLRSQAEFKVRDWKYDPQFRFEYFAPLNPDAAGTISQTRIGIGTEREYDGLGQFGLFFLMDLSKENNVSFVDQIIFMKYTYQF